jgi:hypothetical protein
MAAADRVRRAFFASKLALCVSLVAYASCVGAYQPLLVQPKSGLPEDAYARCLTIMQARYVRLVVADAANFRLQSDWVPGPDPDKAVQQRATVFLEGSALACVVEVRKLGIGWFDHSPSWSRARADERLEEDLGAALEAALGDGSR